MIRRGEGFVRFIAHHWGGPNAMSIQSSHISFGMGGDAGGPQAVSPLPFRMLVAANFLGRRLAVGEEAGPQARQVDKDSLNETLAALAPTVAIEVPNHLGGTDKTLEMELCFKSYDDFRPEGVAAAVPQCAALLTARGQIEELAKEGQSPDQIAARIAPEVASLPHGDDLLATLKQKAPEPAPPEKPSAEAPAGGEGSALDMILEATEEGKPPAPQSGLGSVLDAVAKSGGISPRRKSGGAAQPALDWIDQRLGRQLDAILHHPQIAELEEAWRGLRFLIGRTDFRKGIIIEILPAAKEDLRKLLVDGALENEYNQPGDPPLSVAVIDHGFDSSARDMNELQGIAQAAERLQAPVLVEANAKFFNLESIEGLGAGGSLQNMVTDPTLTKWNGLRQTEPARWLALSFNRMLLRRPWGEESTPVKGCNYKESCQEGTGENLPWGSSVWALAGLMTASFAREGWPHFISGARRDGVIEDLPLRDWEARPGVRAQITLETGLSDMHAQDLSMAGVIPLQCAAKNDRAYATYVPSAHIPKRYSDAGATQDAAMKSLLPYQLYAGRVAMALGRIIGEVAGGGDAESLAGALKQKLLALMATSSGPAPEDSVNVTVADNPDDPMRYLVTFEIKPVFKLFNLTPRLELTAPVAK